MKRIVQLLLLASALPAVAWAIPNLQLDASPAVYDTSTQSSVATAEQFTLFALMHGLDVNQTYHLAAGVAAPPSSSSMNLGSFVFGSQTIDVTADMTWGSPPDMPAHGVYPTWYKVFDFDFVGAAKTTNYNVEDVVGVHTGPVANPSGNAWFVPFEVDVSGLVAGTALVFDLYTYDTSGKKVKFVKAPFSHNGESSGNQVPDGGATVALLGLALLGFHGFRWFARR